MIRASPDVADVLIFGASFKSPIDLIRSPGAVGHGVKNVWRQGDIARDSQRGASVWNVLFRDPISRNHEHRRIISRGCGSGEVAIYPFVAALEVDLAMPDVWRIQHPCGRRWVLRETARLKRGEREKGGCGPGKKGPALWAPRFAIVS